MRRLDLLVIMRVTPPPVSSPVLLKRQPSLLWMQSESGTPSVCGRDMDAHSRNYGASAIRIALDFSTQHLPSESDSSPMRKNIFLWAWLLMVNRFIPIRFGT